MRRDGPVGIAAEWSQVRPALRDLLRQACAERRYPIYLFGEAGRGKTCSAACVMRSWPHDGVRWIRAGEFVELIQRCRRDSQIVVSGSCREVGESHLWRVWIEQPSLIIVDDFGCRAPTESQYEISKRLLDTRGERPAIYTGNLTPKQLHEVYDSRVASRLLAGQPIELTGADKRLERVTLRTV